MWVLSLYLKKILLSLQHQQKLYPPINHDLNPKNGWEHGVGVADHCRFCGSSWKVSLLISFSSSSYIYIYIYIYIYTHTLFSLYIYIFYYLNYYLLIVGCWICLERWTGCLAFWISFLLIYEKIMNQLLIFCALK